MSDHLASAALTLRSILAARQPEHSWIVEIGQLERDDAHRLAAAPNGQPEVRAVDDDAHPIIERDAPAAPGGANDHRAQERA